ncbi:MAG TPA: hypothetical protein VE960_05185, partial [bacterium]|nr:hypothetical protein [bacterium]
MPRLKLHRAIPVLFLLVLLSPVSTPAQCILSNPSFEIGGQGGLVFGGWSQSGTVGSMEFASHGSMAARLTGPDLGGWDESSVWQQQDCSPGEQWELAGSVAHYFAAPLTGDCRAVVTVEWWNASEMISDESYEVALPSAPTDEYQDFSIAS